MLKLFCTYLVPKERVYVKYIGTDSLHHYSDILFEFWFGGGLCICKHTSCKGLKFKIISGEVFKY